jgi:phospholipase/carboxylesterase
MFRTPSLTQSSVIAKSNTLVAHWPTRRSAVPAKRPTDSLHHCLFSPIHYEPNYAYPLLVWLHGCDSSELELRQMMPVVSVRNYVGVAPRGTRRTSQTHRFYSWRQTPGEVADACQRVRDCIEIARESFNIHDDRVFIAGRGEGGTMALRVGMEHPELFAGAISLGGRVPRGGGAFHRINAARRLPLMLSASTDKESFTNEQLMDDVRLLHSGGFSLNVVLYPEGDDLTDTMFSDIDVWLMERACPSAVAAR